jgi:hypothetical protein
VNHEKYGLYSDAVFEYVNVLVRRLAKRYDAPMPDWAARRDRGTGLFHL